MYDNSSMVFGKNELNAHLAHSTSESPRELPKVSNCRESTAYTFYIRNTFVCRVRTVWPDEFSVRSSVADPHKIYDIMFEFFSKREHIGFIMMRFVLFCFLSANTFFRDRDTRRFPAARPAPAETSPSQQTRCTRI